MANILITGITGFIGRVLCNRILSEGWHVKGAVRSLDNIADLPEKVEPLLTPSIDQHTNWSDSLMDVDTVVHLAARVHVMHDNASNSLEAFRNINVAGTERLARTAADAGVRRFIYLSSIKVNGEGKLVSYTENDIPDPRDPYGISKWESEKVLHQIADMTEMEIVILRPPLVYGPGVRANFFKLLAIVNKRIPLPLANISNQRSLIYIENLIDAIVTCIKHPKAAGQTYLVSDYEDISTSELILHMATALGKPARLFPFPLNLIYLAGRICRKTAMIERLTSSLRIDSSKIQHELGWKTPYTMTQGIKKTAKWYLEK